jgi:peptidoglycan hydrolase-like protein with peptidoglycan-binding domain
MTTPYRQPILPGDKGSDIFAVRRALRTLGHQLPARGYTAGPEFVDAIARVQRNHGLSVDGKYGPTVHPIVAPHFDAYGVQLYSRAKLRAHYVNPFGLATQLVAGRIDEGVDYHGVGPILAIGDAVVVGDGLPSRWPGHHYLLYKLSNGVHAGRYVYVAEAIVPKVGAGQKVRAGDVICDFGPDAAPGRSPGIETGWGSATLNRAYAAATTGYKEGQMTDAGKAFARLLHHLGAPVVSFDEGPEFPV